MIKSPLEDIEAAALQLAPGERAKLAERLLISLEEDDEILTAWVEEAERRGDAYERGEMDAIDFDEAIAQARARIASHRAA
jgi:putative addiction module component (TIGR02574 family)